MDKNENRAYRLLAAITGRLTIADALKEQFFRITPDYLLVFTNSPACENFYEITGDNLRELSRTDTEWLAKCCTNVITDYLNRHTDAVQAGQKQFAAEFEAALQQVLKKTGD